MRLWDNAAALRRLYRWLYFMVIVCLLASGGIWVVNSPYFPIRQVQLAAPLQQVAAEDVQTVAQTHLRGNIFKADVNAARVAFAELPWVAEVQVRRLWPDTVEVAITERTAVARWDDDHLVDSTGVIFPAQSEEELPWFVADDEHAGEATARAMVRGLHEFQAALQNSDLAISQLYYSERSAWILVLDNGIKVRLGRENVAQRLRHFVWAWPRILKDRAEGIVYVDMRYKDGFAVRRNNADADGDNGDAAETE
ncbi:cell division protein FtsQ [Neisseria sp. HSC-16F19]|nr:cell division protein FtsQ/DivIB [Neisseria sp. HSC-16F19]MCP2040888.1 cell division protein FtsQ [Neisseria sp. HSC-16F19]